MWSDNETEVDLLRFKYLASAVVKIVKTPHLLPTTVGVFGDWGSGKSSLLKIVEKELANDPAIMCLSFNGWLFEGFEDAKTALMGTILDEIQDRIKKDESLYTKAKNLLISLKERVNWMQLLGMTGRYAMPLIAGLPHLSLATAGQDAMKLLADKSKEIDFDQAKKLLKETPGGEENIRRNIRDFRRDFAKLIEESNIT